MMKSPGIRDSNVGTDENRVSGSRLKVAFSGGVSERGEKNGMRVRIEIW